MNDRLTLLQKEGEAYEKHDDTPTVTFVASSECLTLPYHSLRWMGRDPSNGQVHLEIDAFRIILSGEGLHGLWRELQLFRVREIHEAQQRAEEAMSAPKRCVVRKITIAKSEDLEDAQD